MRTRLLLLTTTLILLLATSANAIKVRKVTSQGKADVKVYVTDSAGRADCIIYVETSKGLADGNAKWFTKRATGWPTLRWTSPTARDSLTGKSFSLPAKGWLSAT